MGRQGRSTEPGLVSVSVHCTASCSGQKGLKGAARLSHLRAFAPVRPIAWNTLPPPVCQQHPHTFQGSLCGSLLPALSSEP